MSGFRIVPPNCTDFQKSVSQRVFKISAWEKVRKKAANIYYFFNKIYLENLWDSKKASWKIW